MAFNKIDVKAIIKEERKDEKFDLEYKKIKQEYKLRNMCQLHNLSTYRWDEIFKDTMITGAMVDRLAHKAHILDISIMNNTL